MLNHFSEFKKIINNAGLNEVVLNSFSYYYQKVINGEKGKFSENEIDPPSNKNLVSYKRINTSNSNLEKLVVIKLNGGLGTSMGLEKAKSLLKVKDELNFLDIIVLQILKLRSLSQKKIPLLFMNSFNTRKDTLSYLKKYPELSHPTIPLDFLQNKYPKIKQSDLSPLHNEHDNLNWNPPGHGEIYSVMLTSGILEQLLEAGFEYMFISNSDNLGALVDENILNYIADNSIPFLMEVCQRTEMDKKGGHLAQTKAGQLILREVAQCHENEIKEFQNVSKYQYFNTNNLWVNLKSLKQKLKENNSFLPLPLILNAKEVEGEKVYQIETAMGSAISIFEGSKAIIVPRSRFLPVKKTNDLLALWSDAFELNSDYHISLNKESVQSPVISLDERYYKNICQFQEHFRDGIPSLKKCRNLKIEGDVFFGENVELRGNVSIYTEKRLKLKNQVIQDEKIN